jgi:23S rRNA pseudouridine1911/1915/1917 synthase
MLIRMDQLVAERFGLSRRAAREAIRNGRIDLAGRRCDEPGLFVEPDAAVAFFPNRPKARKVAHQIKVLFEDRHLLIVDKPAGLLSVPTPDRECDTLLERASRYLQLRHGGRPYLGVVHRLDKDTSGALAFARSPQVLHALQALFKAHTIERQYLAVVEGSPHLDAGTIDLPLIADRGDRRRGVARRDEEGRHAVTHYRVIEPFGTLAALMACWLETGRTHQIRIHLAALGLPVVGEPVYRPRSLPPPKITFHRQALHAQILGFPHPITGALLHVEADPPADFTALLVDLRQRTGPAGSKR